MLGTRTPSLAFALLVPVVALLAIVAVTNANAVKEASRADRLQPLSVAQLKDAPIGGEVLIEGKVSDRTPTRFHSFVAYVRDMHYLDADLSDKWVEVERITPPLSVDLPDGQVQVANHDYRLGNPPVSWQVAGSQVSNPMRYSGLEAGSRIVVIGTVVRSEEGIAVHADVVAGGTRSDYIAVQGGAASWPVLFGGTLIPAVLSGIALLYVMRWRSAVIMPR